MQSVKQNKEGTRTAEGGIVKVRTRVIQFELTTLQVYLVRSVEQDSERKTRTVVV
jgi:hypothetical protein